MNIYFAGSIRGGRNDREIYVELIDHLKQYGNVLTEHIADPDLSFDQKIITNEQIYSQDVAWLASADLVIAEVTQPSLGVGYEIGFAEARGIPIYCLYRVVDGKRVSAMLSGNSTMHMYEYCTVEEGKILIDTIFKNK